MDAGVVESYAPNEGGWFMVYLGIKYIKLRIWSQ